LSMQSYLGFVTNSMGLSQYASSKTDREISPKELIQLDASVDLACNILCQCGPSKVLPMLSPLLEQWLKCIEGSQGPGQVVVARTALSILATCGVNLVDSSGVSAIQEVVPNLKSPATAAMCVILKHFSPIDGNNTNHELDDRRLANFLEPFIILLRQESDMFLQVFADVSSAVGSLAVSEQIALASALLVVCNDVRLASAIRGKQELVTQAKAIETALPSTSRLGSRLRALIEVHCGTGGAVADTKLE